MTALQQEELGEFSWKSEVKTLVTNENDFKEVLYFPKLAKLR